MVFNTKTVSVALILSLAVHGLVAAWFLREREEETSMVEGGPSVQMAVSGDPFNAVSAGQQNATAESPTAEPTETTTTAAPAETPTRDPGEPTQSAQPTQTTETSTPTQTSEAQSSEMAALAETQAAEEPSEPTEAPSAEVAEAQPANEAEPTETLEGMAPAPDNLPQPDTRPTPPQERQVAENIPLPSDTPNLLREPEPQPQRQAQAEPEPEPEPEPQPQQRQTNRRGNQGQQQADSRQGSRQSGQSSRTGGGGSGANAAQARSNYSGQILSRIRRAQRYPSAARSRREQGTASVAFTITARGGLASVRLAGSSGSASIDRAAVQTVRRAAPFPPIPQAVGQRSMSFTVPIRFRLR